MEGNDAVGPDQVDAHQQREQGADGDRDQREHEILNADDAVVGAEEIAAHG
jgi:hypothetical protein